MSTVSPSLVSVIVPAYNAAVTLGPTLRSALGQTHRDIEIVLVDDGSRDETAEIAQSFAQQDSRVRLIRQENAGVAKARNCALANARGGWIAPLDADDLWHPQKIARQLRRAGEEPAGAGVVYCWSVDIDEDDRIIGRRHEAQEYQGDVLAPLLVTNVVGNSSSPLIRRSELEAVGGWDPQLHALSAQGCEDWLLYLRLARRTRFALEPAFLVGYRQLTNAMSRDVRQMTRSYDLVMAEVQDWGLPIPAKVLRWSRAEFEHYAASLLAPSPSVEKGVRKARALALDPQWFVRTTTRQAFQQAVRRPLRRLRQLGGRSAEPPQSLTFYASSPDRLTSSRLDQTMAERRRWLASLNLAGLG